MLVVIVRGGGLLGTSYETKLASDDLPPDAAATLREKARPVATTPQVPAPGIEERVADERTYEITTDDDGVVHHFTSPETALPESIRDLVAWVDSRPESRVNV